MLVPLVCRETGGGKAWSTRLLRLLVLQCGWRNPEFIRKANRSHRTKELHNCVMVNGVPDTEHQLSPHDRWDVLCSAVAIANAIHDRTVTAQNVIRNCCERFEQVLCGRAGDLDRSLDVPIAAAVVVVDLEVPQAFDQAQEVIQYMSVMCANRGTPGSFFFPRIRVLVNAVKQGDSLAEHILRSRDERRAIHVRNAFRYQEFVSGAKRVRLCWCRTRLMPIRRVG